jgi:hypothetical protein
VSIRNAALCRPIHSMVGFIWIPMLHLAKKTLTALRCGKSTTCIKLSGPRRVEPGAMWTKPVHFPTSWPPLPGSTRFPTRLCPPPPAFGSLLPAFIGSLSRVPFPYPCFLRVSPVAKDFFRFRLSDSIFMFFIRLSASIESHSWVESVSYGMIDTLFLKSPFSSKNPHSTQYPCGFYDFSKNEFF